MSQVIVTGTSGPGLTVTAQTFTDLSELTFDLANRVIRFKQDSVDKEISIAAATTITCTVVGTDYNFVIS